MKPLRVASPLNLGLLVVLASACGSSPPEATTPAQAPQTTSMSTPPTTATADPTPPPAEPTPEEKKKAEALAALKADRAKWQAEWKDEVARWTPDLHAAAKTLADKAYPSGHAAITAAVASKTRKPGDAGRDKARHPVETLDFFGFKPDMTVLEYGPGAGWYTELLAPALVKKGTFFVTGSDPNGPEDQRSTLNGQQFKAFLDNAPEIYGKVQTIVIDGKAPKLGHEGTMDMVIMTRELHGMVNNGQLDGVLAEVNNALKPNGILGIEEHRAKADAVPEESAKKGYLPEKWVISKIEAAGFKLAGKSGINANPKDTKDYADGVWTLPPSYRLGDKDKDKYTAIGESDRMTLKFVKVPPAKKAK